MYWHLLTLTHCSDWNWLNSSGAFPQKCGAAHKDLLPLQNPVLFQEGFLTHVGQSPKAELKSKSQSSGLNGWHCLLAILWLPKKPPTLAESQHLVASLCK